MSGTNVLLPLYLYPDLGQPNSQWQKLAQLAIAYPKTEIWAVVNPSNGPGTSADPNYVEGIIVLANSGIHLLGYVDTARATKTVEQVLDETATWQTLYPAVKSFFLDDVENTKSQSYYFTLAHAIHSIHGEVFGNPGTSIPESYIGIFDTAVIYEGDSTPPFAPSGYDPKNFAFLQYGQAALPKFTSWQTYGYIYVTSGTQPNPYSGIPYLQQLLAALQ